MFSFIADSFQGLLDGLILFIVSFSYSFTLTIIEGMLKLLLFLTSALPDLSFMTGIMGDALFFVPEDWKNDVFWVFDRIGFSTCFSLLLMAGTIKILIKLIPYLGSIYR